VVAVNTPTLPEQRTKVSNITLLQDIAIALVPRLFGAVLAERAIGQLCQSTHDSKLLEGGMHGDEGVSFPTCRMGGGLCTVHACAHGVSCMATVWCVMMGAPPFTMQQRACTGPLWRHV
jgi:hypothetical protein